MTNENLYKAIGGINEKYIEEAVRRMRRVKRIEYIQVTPHTTGYNVALAVTSINDENVALKMELE